MLRKTLTKTQQNCYDAQILDQEHEESWRMRISNRPLTAWAELVLLVVNSFKLYLTAFSWNLLNCFRAKEQVKERIQALSASLNPNPSAPSENVVDGQSQNGHLATDEELEACYLADQEGTSWEDVKELLVLEHSMKQFTCLKCAFLLACPQLISSFHMMYRR